MTAHRFFILIFVMFLALPAAAETLLDQAKTVPKSNYLTTNSFTVCMENMRLQARKKDQTFDEAVAEKHCRGRHGGSTGDVISEEMDDLYQICRLRSTYKKFQSCMIDATSVPEDKK